MSADYNTNVIANAQTAEYGKFIKLDDQTRFPAVSVTRYQYFDGTAAFPGNSSLPTLSTVDIYPKFGVISYIANTDEFAVSLSAEQVNLDTTQIEYHLSNIDAETTIMANALTATELNTFDAASGINELNYNFVTSVDALTSNTYHAQISSVNLSDANWLFQVGRGKIRGATLKSFTGYASAVGATFQPIWEDGTYTFLTSAQKLTLKSTSNSDTDVSVFIDGLDANYNPVSETLVLTNGSTGVTTLSTYYRINGISLTRPPMSVGRISIGNATPLAFIPPDTDRSAMTVYSVPAGYTFYLERVNAFCSFTVNTAGNNNVPINAFYRSNTVKSGLRNIILTSPFYSNYSSTRISPRGYPEKTDCLWECRSESDAYKPAIGLQVEGILLSNSAI